MAALVQNLDLEQRVRSDESHGAAGRRPQAIDPLCLKVARARASPARTRPRHAGTYALPHEQDHGTPQTQSRGL
jgi:hypothetical protein